MARARTTRDTVPRGSGPQVIVDFVFDRGLLFIAIRNIGAEPAYGVRVQFSAPLYGLEGTKDVSAQPLFHRLEFLPPQKEIMTYFDTSAAFFRSGQPTRVSLKVIARSAKGVRRIVTIHHDLEIYRDIGYVRRPESSPSAAGREIPD